MISKEVKAMLKAVIPTRTSLLILGNVAVVQSKLVATNLDTYFECFVNGVDDGLYRGDMLKKTGDFVPYTEGEIADFPERPSVSSMDGDKLPYNVLANKFEFFADKDATRQQLKCVAFTKDGNVTATDGHKLIQVVGVSKLDGWETHIPGEYLKALRLMKEFGRVELKSYRGEHLKTDELVNPVEPEEKEPNTCASYVVATAGPATLTIKCIEAEAPNYACATDTTGHTFERFDSGDLTKLIAALKQVEPFTNERTKQMIFDGCQIIGRDRVRSIEKIVTFSHAIFPKYRIGFNVAFLLPLLEMFKEAGGTQYGYPKTPLRGVSFRTDKDLHFFMMPLRLIDETPEEAEPTKSDEKEGGGDTEAVEGPKTSDPLPDTIQTPESPAEEAPEASTGLETDGQTPENRVDEALQAAADQADDFPNPPPPKDHPSPNDRPISYRQIRYLVWLTGRPWAELRELKRKAASAMITELIKEAA